MDDTRATATSPTPPHAPQPSLGLRHAGGWHDQRAVPRDRDSLHNSSTVSPLPGRRLPSHRGPMPYPRFPAIRWPTLLLLASVGFTALGVLEANKAIRSQRAVAEHALHDYAGFAAWSYEQHLRDDIARATREILGAVNHGDGMHSNPHVPDSHELAHYLPWNPRCGCHRPQEGPSPLIFFGWKLGTDTLGVGVNMHSDPAEGWEVDRPMPMEPMMHAPRSMMMPTPRGRVTGYGAIESRWINDTLTRQIRSGQRYGAFPLVVATHDSVPRLFVYTLMPTTWGDT